MRYRVAVKERKMAELSDLFEEIYHSEKNYEAKADYLKNCEL